MNPGEPTPQQGAAFKRVLLKLSGEALMGDLPFGAGPTRIAAIAAQVKIVSDRGVEIAIVVGGGNIYRGLEAAAGGMDRATGDYMGMLATVLNALALQDALERTGARTRVQSAVTVSEVAEPYIRRRAIRHLEKGRVVIFGGGAGMPYFSTDTVSAQRALEIKCDAVLMSKNGVDGVYDMDPRLHPEAKKLDTLTFDEALQRGLRVVDQAAFSLCHDDKLPMVVFGMEGEGNITRALQGERIGTLVTPV